MKNTMVDLNNHLFEQLERLNDEELTDQEFEKEVKRAKAMERIAAEIIDNARVGLQVYQTMMDYGKKAEMPSYMIEHKNDK